MQGARQLSPASPQLLSLHAILDEAGRRSLARPRRGQRARLVRRALLVADVVGLTLAFLVARALLGVSSSRDVLGVPAEDLVFLLALPVFVLVGDAHGLYERDAREPSHSTTDDLVGVIHVATLGAWGVVLTALVSGLGDHELPAVAAFWALAIAFVPVLRRFARAACARSQAFRQSAVIVGAGDVGQLVARKLVNHPEYGIDVVGFVDRAPKSRRADLPESLAILGPPERLNEIVDDLNIERVVVAFSNDPTPETLQLLRTLREHGDVHVDLVPRLFELLGPRAVVHSVEGMSLVGIPRPRLSRTSLCVKRAIDVLVAGVGLLAIAPLLAYIAVRIRRDSPGPVLFRQTRLGRDGREFTALKFRTMKVATDTSVHEEFIRSTMSASAAATSGIYKLDRGDAITPFGRWLRRTSLDELPQLFNVLRGDMSLVGPRPCIPYETEHFEPHHFERFLVPQGLTGLWQVTARASSTFGEALDMDVAYARGWSLWLDLRLLLRTPLAVLRQRSTTA